MLVHASNMHFMQSRHQKTLTKGLWKNYPQGCNQFKYYEWLSLAKIYANELIQCIKFRYKAVLQLSNLNKKKPCKNDMRFVIKRCFSKKKKPERKRKKGGGRANNLFWVGFIQDSLHCYQIQNSLHNHPGEKSTTYKMK